MAAEEPARGPERDAEPQHEAAVWRRRAELLEEELALAERRLTEAEGARSAGAGAIATRDRELFRRRRDDRLVITRLTAPLRAFERGVRWLAEKLGRAAGMAARRIAFRGARRN